MGKQSILVVVGILLVSACAGRQGPATTIAYSDGDVEGHYECDAAPLAVIHGASGPKLWVGGRDGLIENTWRDHEGDHFLSFERVGDDNRPVALEYLVPRNRSGRATLRTYDRSEGAHFKVMVRKRSWRIRGEPSASARCRTTATPIAMEIKQ